MPWVYTAYIKGRHTDILKCPQTSTFSTLVHPTNTGDSIDLVGDTHMDATELFAQGMDATELETFVISNANVTIAAVNGHTVIVIESRDRRKDGLFEAKAFVVKEHCHVNDCRDENPSVQ